MNEKAENQHKKKHGEAWRGMAKQYSCYYLPSKSVLRHLPNTTGILNAYVCLCVCVYMSMCVCIYVYTENLVASVVGECKQRQLVAEMNEKVKFHTNTNTNTNASHFSCAKFLCGTSMLFFRCILLLFDATFPACMLNL